MQLGRWEEGKGRYSPLSPLPSHGSCRRGSATHQLLDDSGSKFLLSFFFSFFLASDDLDDLPNENLFKLLIENMERLNDREVVLSDDDWNRFTQHILIRPRNGVPLPFPEELCQRKDSSDSAQNDKEKKSKNRSTSSMKWRCFIRAVTAFGGGRLILTFLPASFKYVRLMGRHRRSRNSSVESSPRSPHGTSEVEPEGATDEISPHGACGLQKLNNLLVSQGSLEGLFNVLVRLITVGG